MISITVKNKRYEYSVDNEADEIIGKVFTRSKSLGEDLTVKCGFSLKDYYAYGLPFGGLLDDESKAKVIRYVNKFIKLKAIW